MQTFEQVRTQIGAWSRQNFGGQETPYLTVHAAGSIRPNTKRSKEDKPGSISSVKRVVALEGLAPLMGLMEEVGELYGSTCPAATRDALGDIAVYLCDYLTREGIRWPTMAELFVVGQNMKGGLPAAGGLVVALGDLYHAHLKRFQRIRGMENTEEFKARRWDAVLSFVNHLGTHAKEATGTDLLTLLNETWNEIVSKRDWKADAAAGGGATHENTGAMLEALPANEPVLLTKKETEATATTDTVCPEE